MKQKVEQQKCSSSNHIQFQQNIDFYDVSIVVKKQLTHLFINSAKAIHGLLANQ